MDEVDNPFLGRVTPSPLPVLTGRDPHRDADEQLERSGAGKGSSWRVTKRIEHDGALLEVGTELRFESIYHAVEDPDVPGCCCRWSGWDLRSGIRFTVTSGPHRGKTVLVRVENENPHREETTPVPSAFTSIAPA